MTILITGVAGFVGRHLVKYLNSVYPNVSIVGLDVVATTEVGKGIPGFSYTETNLLDGDAVRAILNKVKPEWIIHLASFSSVSYSWEHPSDSFLNNSLIFINLIESCRAECPSCRILSIGSSEEYGKVEDNCGLIAESNPLRPTSPYAVARVSQEMLSRVFVQGYGLDIVMTRSFNHIGPYQRDAFVVPAFVKQFVQAEKTGLKRVNLRCGDLEVIRDFTDVRDVVRAYNLILHFGERGEVYNVCSSEGRKLKDVIATLERLTGIQAELDVDRSLFRPLENHALVGDNSELRNRCGWKPEWSFEASIVEVLEYWRSAVTL